MPANIGRENSTPARVRSSLPELFRSVVQSEPLTPAISGSILHLDAVAASVPELITTLEEFDFVNFLFRFDRREFEADDHFRDFPDKKQAVLFLQKYADRSQREKLDAIMMSLTQSNVWFILENVTKFEERLLRALTDISSYKTYNFTVLFTKESLEMEQLHHDWKIAPYKGKFGIYQCSTMMKVRMWFSRKARGSWGENIIFPTLRISLLLTDFGFDIYNLTLVFGTKIAWPLLLIVTFFGVFLIPLEAAFILVNWSIIEITWLDTFWHIVQHCCCCWTSGAPRYQKAFATQIISLMVYALEDFLQNICILIAFAFEGSCSALAKYFSINTTVQKFLVFAIYVFLRFYKLWNFKTSISELRRQFVVDNTAVRQDSEAGDALRDQIYVRPSIHNTRSANSEIVWHRLKRRTTCLFYVALGVTILDIIVILIKTLVIFSAKVSVPSVTLINTFELKVYIIENRYKIPFRFNDTTRLNLTPEFITGKLIKNTTSCQDYMRESTDEKCKEILTLKYDPGIRTAAAQCRIVRRAIQRCIMENKMFFWSECTLKAAFRAYCIHRGSDCPLADMEFTVWDNETDKVPVFYCQNCSYHFEDRRTQNRVVAWHPKVECGSDVIHTQQVSFDDLSGT